MLNLMFLWLGYQCSSDFIFSIIAKRERHNKGNSITVWIKKTYCYTIELLKCLTCSAEKNSLFFRFEPLQNTEFTHFSKAPPMFKSLCSHETVSFSFSSHLKSEVRSLLGFITAESPVDTDDCCLDLSGCHKFNYVKCCEKSLYISTSPHAQYSRLAETPSLCVRVWRNDTKTCSNFLRKPTSTTGIKIIITS